jgi:hypothetical protein
MDVIPLSAFALVIVVLLVIWFFLAHMISSGKDDARLQFLLSLMDAAQADVGHPDAVTNAGAPAFSTNTPRSV